MDRRILLITGPAGAGKTSTASEWASNSDKTCAHLPLDLFRKLVKSDYRDPRQGWNDEAQRQLDIARAHGPTGRQFGSDIVDVPCDATSRIVGLGSKKDWQTYRDIRRPSVESAAPAYRRAAQAPHRGCGPCPS